MSGQQHAPDALARWNARFLRWGRRLRAAHLDGLAVALLEAAEPLGPLGAQVLWWAQPTLSLFVPRDEIGALARALEAPQGLAWVRAQLTGVGEDEGDA